MAALGSGRTPPERPLFQVATFPPLSIPSTLLFPPTHCFLLYPAYNGTRFALSVNDSDTSGQSNFQVVKNPFACV